MNAIDKAAVRRSFNQAAQYYDENAYLQRAVSNRLLAHAIPLTEPTPAQILDAGAGSGLSTETLAGVFPNSRIVGLDFAQEMLKIAQRKLRKPTFVCGDLEMLPLASSTFDLVCSSSALQWSSDAETTLRELCRVLKGGAPLLIATYTGGTLCELQHSWRGIDDYAHTLAFPTPDHLCCLLRSLGMTDVSCQTQNEVVLYDSVDALLKTLKNTGVRNFRRDRRPGLTHSSRLESMKARYRMRYAVSKQIPATYAITFIFARAAAAVPT